MIYTAFQASAAAYCVYLAGFMHTQNARSAFLFRFIPGVIGIGMSFFLLARFMGWPV